MAESIGADITAEGNAVSLASGSWETVSLEVSEPPIGGETGYRADDIRRLGVVVGTGASGAYGPVVVHVGAVWLEDR
jgi:hypothetical protein